MEDIESSTGKIVTEGMLDEVCAALDADEWPEGWRNVGGVVGRPPMSPEGSTVLSVKVPPAMKQAIADKAQAAGVSTSVMVRAMLEESLHSAL